MSVQSASDFEQWFKRSSVLDSRGQPLRVFHGTRRDFEQFCPQPNSHLGFHFGSAEQANKRLQVMLREDCYLWGLTRDQALSGHQVRAHYLRIINPLRTVDAGDWSNPYAAWEALNKATRGALAEQMLPMIEQTSRQERLSILRRRIQALGFDGVVYRNHIEGQGDSWIALESGQIRSAFARMEQGFADVPQHPAAQGGHGALEPEDGGDTDAQCTLAPTA